MQEAGLRAAETAHDAPNNNNGQDNGLLVYNRLGSMDKIAPFNSARGGARRGQEIYVLGYEGRSHGSMKQKPCEVEGCLKRPSFNLSGIKAPRFCGDHQLKGMVNVKQKPCEVEGCLKRPSG